MNWKEKKILLVEDQHRGEFIVEFLETKFDLNITRARNVEEAMHYSTKFDYDLYILDVMMPTSENSPLYEYGQKQHIFDKYYMFTGLILLKNLHEIKNGEIKSIIFSARSKEEIDRELGKMKPDIRYDFFVSKSDEYHILYNAIEILLNQ